MKLSKQNKRDAILVIFVLVILGSFFGYREWIYEPGEAVVANVFYGNASNPIVTIDFSKEQIILNYTQPEAQNYPTINEKNATITLLGDYEINGVRQELVIRYNFTKKTVQVIEEESPYNVCSNQGESNGETLICLPNSIRIEFSTATQDFIL